VVLSAQISKGNLRTYCLLKAHQVFCLASISREHYKGYSLGLGGLPGITSQAESGLVPQTIAFVIPLTGAAPKLPRVDRKMYFILEHRLYTSNIT